MRMVNNNVIYEFKFKYLLLLIIYYCIIYNHDMSNKEINLLNNINNTQCQNTHSNIEYHKVKYHYDVSKFVDYDYNDNNKSNHIKLNDNDKFQKDNLNKVNSNSNSNLNINRKIIRGNNINNY